MVASKRTTSSNGTAAKVIKNTPSKIEKESVKKAIPSQQIIKKSTEPKITKKEPVRRVHGVTASKEEHKKGN